MRFLTNLSTQTRLFLVFGLLSLVAAFIAVGGIINAASFQEQIAQLRARSQSLEDSNVARAELVREQLAIKNALLSDDPKDWAGVFEHGGQFENYLNSASYSVASDQETQLLDEIWGLRDQYSAGLDPIYASTYEENFDPQEALLTVKDQIDPLAVQMQTRLAAISTLHMNEIDSLARQIEGAILANAASGRRVILILAVLLILGVYITSQITRPLHSLTSAIVAFQNNTYHSEMLAPFLPRQDELGKLANAVDAMAASITESNRMKDRFLQSASRFIPTQYLEFLEKPAITEVNLGDHVSAEMAVMFSDIRGFTTASEKMTPKENFEFINEYLKLVSPVIQQHEGFIVKFLGDGMMAIFTYGVDDAIQAGIEKQKKVKEFNALLVERGFAPVTVGIGVHTGNMMVGMVGEERRMQGDAFSDNVNLTSRIEGLNKFFGTSMIVSGDTLNNLKQPVPYKMRYLGKVQVKGRQTPLALYEIFEGLPDEVVACKEASRADFERGIALYTQGQFVEAQQAFNAVLQVDPGDKTARYYLERCAEWAGQSAPANWNGAVVMTDK